MVDVVKEVPVNVAKEALENIKKLNKLVKGKTYEELPEGLDIIVYEKEEHYAELYYYNICCEILFDEDTGKCSGTGNSYDIINDSETLVYDAKLKEVESYCGE